MYIPVVYLGGQYNHLIKRRLEELNVRSKLLRPTMTSQELIEEGIDGLVLGGGPYTLPNDYDKLSNVVDYILNLNVPIMGICLSHQLIALTFGGKAGRAAKPEYGNVEVEIIEYDPIFEGVPKRFIAWASHNDEVLEEPKNFKVLASSENCRVEAMKHRERTVYGLQFHPEVEHTQYGVRIFKNFIEIVKSHS